jgi:ABC-type uncharacterized transport system fused permease/ATPase subunit
MLLEEAGEAADIRPSCVVQDCFFLPQKAYMPLGTLRQQLIFPQHEDEQQLVESDVALRNLAGEAHLHSASQEHVHRKQVTCHVQ